MAAQARSEDSKAFKKVTFEFGSFKLRYAWVSQRGSYPEDLDKANQDAHREVENFGKASGIMDTAFFGVFDGHGKTGNYCAEFTRDHMPELLEQHLVKVRPPRAVARAPSIPTAASLARAGGQGRSGPHEDSGRAHRGGRRGEACPDCHQADDAPDREGVQGRLRGGELDAARARRHRRLDVRHHRQCAPIPPPRVAAIRHRPPPHSSA
jgi:hypothetical protein